MSDKRSRELPTDRLSTTDKEGRRIYLFPADVRGRFRSARNYVHAALIIFFLALPWLRIDGHQAVLLDIPNRRFALFGLRFWAHDAPMLFFLLAGGALTLGLVTAVWGRVWCGWACPQTVFIDSVFRTIERFFEGDHLARQRLAAERWFGGPLSGEKVYKKGMKWLAFTAVTLVISHSFLAYFVGTDELALMIRRSPSEHPLSFGIMLFVAGGILFDFGWFREQFCTVLCPYGRFQSLLMDDHSLVVAYDTRRGEPRKGTEPPDLSTNAPRGDCVNCYRCVQVCPTGIDIRRGTQLECIGCTACIDACDDVMTRLSKPTGLIRYDSAVGLGGAKTKRLRGRVIVYATLLAVVTTGLVFSIVTRQPLQAAFVRAKDMPYQEIQNAANAPEIVNRFKVDLSNQSFEDVSLIFRPSPEQAAAGLSIVTAQVPLVLKAGAKTGAELFFKFPKSLLKNGRLSATVNAYDHGASAPFFSEEITLVGPF